MKSEFWVNGTFNTNLSSCWRSADYPLGEGEISSRSCDILPRLMFTGLSTCKWMKISEESDQRGFKPGQTPDHHPDQFHSALFLEQTFSVQGCKSITGETRKQKDV